MENTSISCQHTSENSSQTPKQFVMESQWRDMVNRCQSSGLTVREWCKANGMNENTYYYRLKRLRKKALNSSGYESTGTSDAPALVEIQRPSVHNNRVTVMQEPDVSSSSIQMSFHGARLTIPEETSPKLLHMVLTELNSIPQQ